MTNEIDPIPFVTAPSNETAVATVDDYLRRIRSNWNKCAKGLLDVAAVCREATERLSEAQVKTLLKSEFPINRSTFWKFVTIGRDHRLAGIAATLPPNFSTIYEVALLSDKQLEEAVDSNVIHPKVRRAEVAALRKPSDGGGDAATTQDEKHKEASQPGTIKIEAGRWYELRIPETAGEDDCKHITEALGKLRSKFSVEISPIEAYGVVPAGAAVSPSSPASSPVNRTANVRVHQRLNTTTSLSSGARK
jgi:hypothetical protein